MASKADSTLLIHYLSVRTRSTLVMFDIATRDQQVLPGVGSSSKISTDLAETRPRRMHRFDEITSTGKIGVLCGFKKGVAYSFVNNDDNARRTGNDNLFFVDQSGPADLRYF
jgi:hypothetical protein